MGGAIRKLLRAVRNTLNVLAALLIGVYLCYNVYNSIAAASLRGDLEAKATREIPQAIQRVETPHNDAQARVGGKPEWAWTEQTCEFGSVDAGWIVQGYREECALASFSAWPADDASAARQMAGGLANAPTRSVDAPDECTRLGSDGDSREPDSIERKAGYLPPGIDFDAEFIYDIWCADLTSAANERRVLYGDPLKGKSKTGLLVISTRTQLLREDIGCSRWSVAFCTNPFSDKHAFGSIE